MIERSPMGGVRLLLIEMIIVILLQRIDFDLQYSAAGTTNQAGALKPDIFKLVKIPERRNRRGT